MWPSPTQSITPVTAQAIISAISASVQSSAAILLGGYYFRMTGTDSDLKLEMAKSDSGQASGILFMYQKTDSADVITADTGGDQTVTAIYPTFAAVTVAGSNIIAAYEQVEFNVISRDSTVKLWKITMARNGNSGAVLAAEYFGS